MASLNIKTAEAALRQLEAEMAKEVGQEHPWWTKLMEAYYPYPFQREGDSRAQYWREATLERLLAVQDECLTSIKHLNRWRALQNGRNLHGVSREILRRQMEAIKNDGIEFLNGKGFTFGSF